MSADLCTSEIDVLLEEVMEISHITGTSIHELLGISKEKLKEFMEKYEEERKPMVKVGIPSFEVEP